MAQVSVVIVCMGDPAVHLYACLDSLAAQNRTPLDVWVVAYLMSAEQRKALAARYPSVHLVESNEVRGFAENNNLALRQIGGEYCFIVNDDTLQSMPVVDRLLADFSKLPENAAVVQPKIVFPNGRVQTCGRTPWTAWRYAKHYLHWVDEGKTEGIFRPTSEEKYFSCGCSKNHFSSDIATPTLENELFRTYTLNGACFLINTEVFRKMGWFDERYFFTPEDIALGHKLNEAGYTVWADADVVITHLAGRTAGPMEAAIKPARVKGSLLFYGEGKWLKTKALALFIWCVEAARYLKHLGHCDTARNIMRSVFDHSSAKETFIRFRP